MKVVKLMKEVKQWMSVVEWRQGRWMWHGGVGDELMLVVAGGVWFNSDLIALFPSVAAEWGCVSFLAVLLLSWLECWRVEEKRENGEEWRKGRGSSLLTLLPFRIMSRSWTDCVDCVKRHSFLSHRQHQQGLCCCVVNVVLCIPLTARFPHSRERTTARKRRQSNEHTATKSLLTHTTPAATRTTNTHDKRSVDFLSLNRDRRLFTCDVSWRGREDKQTGR